MLKCSSNFGGHFFCFLLLNRLGEKFKPQNDRMFRRDLFSEQELSVLEYIAKIFQSTNTNEIIALNHLEEVWIKNEKGKEILNFNQR